MPNPPKINMCLNTNIEKYCFKKRQEQAQYKKIVTSGNNPLFTSRQIYSQQQQSRSAVSSVIPVTISFLQNNYYDQNQTDNIFLSQQDANDYFLTKSDAMTYYLRIYDATLNYLHLNDASNTYLSIANASNKYLSIANASTNYLGKQDAINTYLSITDASNTYAKLSYATQLDTRTQQLSFTVFGSTTTVSGNVRIGEINPVIPPSITINGNILIGNPSTNDANTQRIRIGDEIQLSGSCNDILITPKANGNVIIGGTGANNGCRLDINNGTNAINIGGSVSSHNGNINIGTSAVATNKVNIGSASIPTYINGNVRVKNQYFTQASSTVIQGNTVISLPCHSTYSISNPSQITITLPLVSSSDIGLKLTFVRVSYGSQVSFKAADGQSIYDGGFNQYTEIALMSISKNAITLVYLNIDDINYGWFQM